MKTIVGLLLLLLTQGPARTRSIEGVVVDAVTGRPIDATVNATRSSATTDASGHFRLDGVPLGRQQFRVLTRNYVTKQVTFDIASDEPKDLTIRLQKPGVVSGQVIDTRGRPVVGAEVHLMGYQFLGFR